MKIIENLRMIVINLIQNKYKVFLTSLGIIIGTITIILVIAIGQGGEKRIADQFKNMSAETIYINFQPSESNLKQKNLEKLTMKELEVIKDENPFIKDIYLRDIFSKDIIVNGKKESTLLTGVTEGYSEVSNYKIEVGIDLSSSDFEDGRKNIILGYSLAEDYFGSPEKALNKSVTINGYRYKIIGVLKKMSEGMQGVNPDETIFLPYETMIGNELSKGESFPQAVALAKDKESLQSAIDRIQSTLDYVFEDSSSYIIEDAGTRIKAAMESATTMKVLLISIAIIVFIVGGIGIMNVLFVSVKERTKEIGILKAIGTTQKDILLLFLLESIGIGIFGGLIGVLSSYIVVPIMENSSIPIYVTLKGKLLAMSFAITTAAVFGFYPAYKASKLKPIDALNHE